jgi:hypothetical protein
MTDTEMKDLFQRVLEDPGPPLAGTDRVLGAARRTARRRRAGTAVACSALAAVAVAGAAVGVPALAGALTPAGHHAAGSGGTSPTGSASGATNSGPPTGGPSPSHSDVAHESIPATPQGKADRMLAALLAAVPAGYTTPTTDTASDANGQRYEVRGTQVMPTSQTGENNGKGWHLDASTDVYRGDQAGAVAVTVTDNDQPVPDGDVCQLQIQHQGSGEQSCQTVMVSGTRVRVSVRDLGQYGKIWYATVFTDGWTTQVQEGQNGLRPGSALLATLPYTPQQLAQLAMNPAFQFQP